MSFKKFLAAVAATAAVAGATLALGGRMTASASAPAVKVEVSVEGRR